MPAAGAADSAVAFANVSYAPPGEPARTILRNVSLSIAPGTTTALLGRSGSGKTTLLRMVNALVLPTTGQVRVDGRATTDSDPIALRRSIGYVIQETGLFPHMTVERNSGLALELAGIPASARRSRVAEVLALTGLSLDDFGARYPWQLSGGQRQRVGLARALAANPGILLMDEPFGALDPLTRAEMQSMLRDLLARVGKTVLLVTHDLDEALFLAGSEGGRIVFLDAGQIVADLPAAEVLHSANPHVQAYVRAVHRNATPSP
ncbi:MAG TPA: ATP-binding cassette domain-containing protein [Acidobacteriaceae bacterium]|nr:ATP-binding cassette domain-containing protein [Acidobacteriaceae bacterium]